MNQPTAPSCITVDPTTIRAAFQKHLEVHHSKPKAWDIPYHIGCWGMGERAFRQASFDGFKELYGQLRGNWQVFRPMPDPDIAGQVYDILTGLSAKWGQRRLSEIGPADCPGLLDVVNTMAFVKPTGDGPSIMAVSKFLHFLNPGLFVIVDRAVVWNAVLRRPLLWPQITVWRQFAIAQLPGVAVPYLHSACDAVSYVAILLWAGELVRKNPEIPSIFADYVAKHAGGKQLPPGIIHYQAPAVEWFLLGLVELGAERGAGLSFQTDSDSSEVNHAC